MTRLLAIQADITTLEVDAIVNAANSSLMGGGGVDGAIHRAGGPSILEECKELVDAHGPLPTGRAVVTGGGDLPARFVIHTVGPIWGEFPPDEAAALLASCYTESLQLAAEHSCRTVAFPSISTGVYGFPKERAAPIATAAARSWLESHPHQIDEVLFVTFSEADLEHYQKLLP